MPQDRQHATPFGFEKRRVVPSNSNNSTSCLSLCPLLPLRCPLAPRHTDRAPPLLSPPFSLNLISGSLRHTTDEPNWQSQLSMPDIIWHPSPPHRALKVTRMITEFPQAQPSVVGILSLTQRGTILGTSVCRPLSHQFVSSSCKDTLPYR